MREGRHVGTLGIHPKAMLVSNDIFGHFGTNKVTGVEFMTLSIVEES